MAKRISHSIVDSRPLVVERYEWRYKPFFLDTCELWREGELIASMKRQGIFPVKKFYGMLHGHRFELRLGKQRLNDAVPNEREIIQYSFQMEGRKDEWKLGGRKFESARLEFTPNVNFGGKYSFWTGYEGPSFINIPAKIVFKGMGEYSIKEKIEGSNLREYSIMDNEDERRPRVLARTTRPPEGELCGTFEHNSRRDGDPEPLLLAIISYAFAQIIWHTIDAHA